MCMAAGQAQAREHIHAVGSSTVFPFVAAAAEQFGRGKQFRTPIVEANGTGGGFKMFCEGVGENTPDVANASRPIKASEVELCAKHGVKNIAELRIGYDGIVFANKRQSARLTLTKETIFLALARHVPKDGTLVTNPYTRWNEIDPALPDVSIEVYGPPPVEGTRDAFIELVMEEGCKAVPEYKAAYADDAARKRACSTLREDGRFIELLGGNVMVQKLVNNPDALGIFSYSYLDQNRSVVEANPVGGVLPDFAAIVSGKYSVARSLFVYVKGEHVGQTPGLAEFAQFLASDAATGGDGFLIVKGLIPLATADHQAIKAEAAKLK